MIYRVLEIIGGYALAAVFLGLWVGARSDLAAEVERCNTDKVAAMAAASELAREAEASAWRAQVAQAERMAAAERDARLIAEEAAAAAEGRPERVRVVIRESTDACLKAVVPAPVVERLRD